MFKKIKQLFCDHDYHLYGKEILIVKEQELETYTLICSRCRKQIIIRNRMKEE